MDMSTDVAWEAWGQNDPYFGVITDPKFRRSSIDETAKREFFQSGESHVQFVLETVRKHIAPTFAPETVLDFGCGVGRLLLPFSEISRQVVGIDVSPSMLEEANRNCADRGLRNVTLMLSNDTLSTLPGKFDLIHSCIVFQHIPIDRGRSIFANLLSYLSPGGVGALQLTYSKSQYAPTNGIAALLPPLDVAQATQIKSGEDPQIQMNPYNMNEILFAMQLSGVTRFHTEFTDHGGELGVFLFFQMPFRAHTSGHSASLESL